jgi:cell division protein FtsW (lipid II flippase)
MLFIITFALILLLLTYQCFISAWQNNENKRYLRLVSAMLCMAALFQLIVTLLGNLRVIPLTGLGAPLISIGLSSSITASIGIGLAIGLCFGKK